MSRDNEPVVDNWYENLESGRKFEVTDIDEDNGMIEIQYLDGDTAELDLDEWYELELEAIEAPEEAEGYDDEDEEDEEDLDEEDDLDEDEDEDDEDWDDDDEGNGEWDDR